VKALLLQQTTQQRPASALGILAMGVAIARNPMVAGLASRRNGNDSINGNRAAVNNASRPGSVFASRIHRFNTRNNWKHRSIIRGETPQVAGG
jgi:hypothetical protein